MNIPPNLRVNFENGYRPTDEPWEQRCYKQWQAEREGRDREAVSPGPSPSPDEPAIQRATRRTARSLLHELIQRHRECAMALEDLSKSLPLELPPAADEGLWRVLSAYRV